MSNINYLKDLFESIPDYRKIVFLVFLIKNDDDLLLECGFFKSDINRLCDEYKNIITEQIEDYLDFIKKRRRINN